MRRATSVFITCKAIIYISIHALRAEGDFPYNGEFYICRISIHALRAEGDRKRGLYCIPYAVFLSTPSVRRATAAFSNIADMMLQISIHALRAEGDRVD